MYWCGWEDRTEVIVIKIHLSLIDLANTLPIRENGRMHVFLSFSNLLEMHPSSIHVDLVASLCILLSNDTTWMQRDPHSLASRPVLVSERLFCSRFIHLMNFPFRWNFLLNKLILLDSAFTHGLLDLFLYLQNVSIANFATLSYSTFIRSSCSAWDHFPLLLCSEKNPSMSLMH